MWEIFKFSISKIHPAVAQAAQTSLAAIVVIILGSIIEDIPGDFHHVIHLCSAVAIGVIFLKPTHSLVSLGTETIETLHQYGKLLLPVMTSALAAQGGISSSAVLYTGTSLFCSVLTGLITRFIVPMLYIYMGLSIANSAIGENVLKKIQDFVKCLMTWSMKSLLYFFTGYLTISGVISGTADASAVKAAKLAISGVVPVVGKILSDASETILVSAGIMKNSAGIYGLLAITAVWIQPFLQIGCQYLLTKITGSVCHVIGSKQSAELVESFSVSMGMILAMTGTVCLLLMISTVCFMKGIS